MASRHLQRSRPNFYRGCGTWLYAQVAGSVVDPHHRALCERLADELPRRARLLDVGCGPGSMVLDLAARRPDALVVGADPAGVAVARLGRGAAAAGLANVRAVRAPAEHLPFPDGVFHAVTSTGSLKHWSDIARGLSEIRRVLRPRGIALLYELDPAAGPERFAGLTGSRVIASAVLSRAVLPRSIGRDAVRGPIAASGLIVVAEGATPDLPFYHFELRRD